MALACKLARPARGEMEPVRELLSGRQLLRLGRAQRLWSAYAPRARWHREFPLQNAERLSAPHQARARQTSPDRGVRLRYPPPKSRCERMGARCAGRSIFGALAGSDRFLLVERIVEKRRRAEAQNRHEHLA